jgi:acylpyruvate hydrolase
MRLGTLRRAGAEGTTTVAVRVDEHVAVEIPGHADVGALLQDPAWESVASAADGPAHDLAGLDPRVWAPVVPRPSKIVCVGLNYRSHILEMGRELPEHPTLFAKYPEALVGPYDPIVLPAHAAGAVDWEGELAAVVGRTARRLAPAEAGGAVAGYAVLNAVSMRDYLYRTPVWRQGMTFEGTTPLGPWLTTPGGLDPVAELVTEVDGEPVQRATIDDLVFDPAALVAYVSEILTLNPGDVIATGTPGGVGHARRPPRYLAPGQTLVTSVTGLGTLRNDVVLED